MQVSWQKTVVVFALVIVMLLALAGWSARMVSTPFTPFHTGSTQSSHVLAAGPNYYCLPPPRNC